METLHFGDPNGAALFAVLIVGFGVLVAAIAYAILANTRAKRFAITTAAVIVVGAGALAYWLYLTPFYSVEIDADEVRLRSYYPSRAVTLARGEIDSFERRNEVKKNEYVVVLVVRTRDGRTFTSGMTRPQTLAEQTLRLQTWLAAP